MAEKENTTKDSLLTRLKFLFTPMAIGVYVTIAFTAFAFNYYIQKEQIEEASLFARIFHDIDQKSIDYRLRFRGPRKGSERVAVIAVDDDSINEVGRWPWPRDLMAQIFKNAWDNGASVIGADIVWSEATDKPQEKLANKLKEQLNLDPTKLSWLNNELMALDGDQKFIDTIENYSEKFVAGAFYLTESNLNYETAYAAVCKRLMFEQSKSGKLFANDYLPIIAIDSNDLYFPETLADAYRQYLASYDELGGNPHTKKIEFCLNDFLTSSDPLFETLSQAWPQILEIESSIQAASFEEWAQNFKSSYLANQVYESNFWTTNLQPINEVTQYSGYFNAKLDGDGTIRRTRLVVRTGNQYISNLSLKSFLLATGQLAEVEIFPNPKITGAKGINRVTINSGETGNAVFDVPVASDGSLIINYAGPQRMFPYIKASSLIDPDSENLIIYERTYDKNENRWGGQYESKEVSRKEFLKDKILIAGATAIGVYDLRVTPFEENFPGVETHANVVDNLLRRDFLSTDIQEPINMPIFLLIFGVLISFVLSRVGAVWGFCFTLLCLIAITFVDRQFFFEKGVVVSVAFPFLLAFNLYLLVTFYKYFTEERGRKELRQTFSKYVSPQIVSEILKDPKNLELGGKKEEITVFFSDVRGFTTISEKLDPKDLSDLLNSYLTPMTELVFSNQGTLDKYIGDAIMAFFGAPIPLKDHAKHACRSSLQQLEKLERLRKEYKEKNMPDIDIGIGLNSGEASVGNMGSETVRNYTVMGDTVNLAARLEGITKEYGVRIVISESTYELVKDVFICRLLDSVRVKGKLKPVKIYELLGETKVDETTMQMKQGFEAAFQLYQAKRFKEALDGFKAVLEITPTDKASEIYIERCQNFIESPPPEDWDGVYVMTKK